MAEFPHSYRVSAAGGPSNSIPTRSADLPTLETGAPPEFGGEPGFWSPETMLTGAVANCYILTFRAISRKAGLGWESLDVAVEGILDKTPDGLKFTGFKLDVRLQLQDPDADRDKAEELLQKAEKHCLVTASLSASVELATEITAE